MVFFRSRSSRSAAETQPCVPAGADRLMASYGVHAYEEARRRRYRADSVSGARYWLRVKAEIGRRLVDGCGDAAHFDRLEAKLSGFAAFSATRDDECLDWSAVRRTQEEAVLLKAKDALRRTELVRQARDEGMARTADSPATDSPSTSCAPGESGERREIRREAEADARAAMKTGDLDGLRKALARLRPSALALT
jgi:hypothetical protein